MAKKLLIVGMVIVFIVVLSVLLLRIFEPYIRYEAMGGRRGHCQSLLRDLGYAIKEYAEKNQGKLTLQSNWADILRDELFVSPKSFICPGAKNKSYSHALNKNVIGLELDKIPDDLVILFDSKPGWNQVGGPELLAPENHGGKGCNILFGNFEVKFIEKENFGELKWDIEPLKEE